MQGRAPSRTTAEKTGFSQGIRQIYQYSEDNRIKFFTVKCIIIEGAVGKHAILVVIKDIGVNS